MKRNILYIIASLFSMSAFCSDLIILNDNSHIDAEIAYYNNYEIKYKKASMPEGPYFILPTRKVNSIIFDDGTAYAYNYLSCVEETIYKDTCLNDIFKPQTSSKKIKKNKLPSADEINESKRKYIKKTIDMQMTANDCFIANIVIMYNFNDDEDQQLLNSICDAEHIQQLLDDEYITRQWIARHIYGYDKRLEKYMIQKTPIKR